MRRPAPSRGGFTLLEVMISLAILSLSLVAISGLNGGAIAMEAYSRRATEATLLLRAKMNDLEDQLHKDGFSDFDDDKRGTFEDEGAPGYSWRAEILKPDLQIDATQLLSLFGMGPNKPGDASNTGSASSTAPAPGTGSPLAQGIAAAAGMLGQSGGAAAMAGGPIAGVLQGQAQSFIETIKKSVREVRVTVSWQDGKDERSITATQEIVILPESVGKAGQVQAAAPQPVATQPVPTQPGQFPRPRSGRPSADGDSQ